MVEKRSEPIQREERPVSFTKRELQVLQGLVDGLSKKQIASSLDREVTDFITYSRLIVEKCSEDVRINGLRKAIVIAVRDDLLDLSNLPDDPRELLSGQEVQVLVASARGFSTGMTSKFMGISPRSFRAYRAKAYRKIGIHTSYQATAWVAREMKRHGQL